MGGGGREDALAWALRRTPGIRLRSAPGNAGIARRAERVAPDAKPTLTAPSRPDIPHGAPLNSESIATLIGALLPDQAIVTDESVTTGRNFFPATAGAPRTWQDVPRQTITCVRPIGVKRNWA